MLSSAPPRYRVWQSIFIAMTLSATACILAKAITLPIITLLNHLKIATAVWQQAAISLLISLLLLLIFHFFTLLNREKISFWRSLTLAFKRGEFPLLIYHAGIFLFRAERLLCRLPDSGICLCRH